MEESESLDAILVSLLLTRHPITLNQFAEGGKYPIVVDTSPCLANIKGHLKNKDLRWVMTEEMHPANVSSAEEGYVRWFEIAKHSLATLSPLPSLALNPAILLPTMSRFALYEPVEFISTFLTDKLEWEQVREKVAIHVPCSSKQMGVSSHFAKVRRACRQGGWMYRARSLHGPQPCVRSCRAGYKWSCIQLAGAGKCAS